MNQNIHFHQMATTVRQKIMRCARQLHKHTKRQLVRRLGIGTALGVVALFGLFSVFAPQTIHFSYADATTCISSPKLLSGMFHDTNAGAFRLTRPATLSIGHFGLYSSQVCATPLHTPSAIVTQTGHEKLAFLGKSIHVVTSSYPGVTDLASVGSKPVSLTRPLRFHLSTADATFSYALAANGTTGHCNQTGTVVACSLTPLKLGYSTTHPVVLIREFHQTTVNVIATKQIQTISAASITNTSITGPIMYDQSQHVTLQTNKPLSSVKGVVLSIKNNDGSYKPVPSASSFTGTTITLNITSPLPRKASFDVHIADIVATDGSTLEAPYDLGFETSGGPKVVGMSAARSDIPQSSTFSVAFDQVLLATQNATAAVSLLVNGTKQPATVTISDQKLHIVPTDDLPLCAHITIQIDNSIQSAYNVSGDSSYSFATRARCYTTFSIGTSVKGRPMTAYHFGTGASLVLYIGATHGNESNTAVLLQKWISDLIANPDKIPAGRSIVVIPEINPDGVAANTRVNADGIDLNRNFPSNSWQTVVTEPGGASTSDGGPSPLSEPESKALAAYVQSVRPRFVLTYHSKAGVVEANDAGDSIDLGAHYASMAKYQAIPTYAIGNTFDYSTSGAFEDWMNDKLGLPAFVIELQSPTADEFSRNEAAMWYMTAIAP